MFSWRTDASKIALAALVAFCRAHGIGLIDCQQHTRHLESFGAREISRAAFERELSPALQQTEPRRWTYDRAMWAHLGLEPHPQKEASAP
jgi:leucyl/phenylalanyl-tRNA--protein transferase